MQSTLVAALVLSTRVADAEPSQNSVSAQFDEAAVAFDAGVKAFERAEFGSAARQFLRADELVPNTDALYNALAAAQQAKDDALLATAAERAVSREASAAELSRHAQKTLADVRRRVARLVLSCEPTPCELAIDGEHAARGANYALPGARLVTARGADGSLAERKVEAVAAREEVIALEVESRPSEQVASTRAHEPRPEPMKDASLGQSRERKDRARPLSPAFFYAGAGVTLALAAATTWSGIDTLNAKDSLPGTQSDNDAVMSRAHRTDALLLGTVLAGAATATIGLVWTDWDGSGSKAALQTSLGERGLSLSITGTL